MWTSLVPVNARGGECELQYIDQIIMFAAGIWMSAVGFDHIKFSSDQELFNRFVWHFKWMGPLLALIAVALAFAPVNKMVRRTNTRAERS
ncbi:hypothetical protein CQ054_22230 [Ochrobactrum sp. MYb29]|nr:hypothetical protein CWE02_10220 [Brucella pituitosa]PRA78384.1 hypothetical protein CQ054_22230 [Ochrobactrum sp. MYb29]